MPWIGAKVHNAAKRRWARSRTSTSIPRAPSIRRRLGGGFLGVGTKDVAVKWSDLKIAATASP